MWKYIIAWFPMIFIAIINGWLREKFLTSCLNDLQAHQMSTLSLIILFGFYVWIIIKIWTPRSIKQVIYIGLLWLFLTIVFEFLFGHYIVGHPWDKLLQDYNILQGRIWILVLIWTFISPYFIYKIQKRL